MTNTNRRPVNRVTPGRRRPVRVAGATRPAAATPATPATPGPAVEDAIPGASRRRPRLSLPRLSLPRPSTPSGGRQALWLGAVAIGLGAFAVLAAFKPGAVPANKAFVNTAATDEVKAAAVHDLTTLQQYKAADIDKLRDTVKPVLTDKMYQDFLKTADFTISSVKQSKIDTDVRVDPIGVTLLSGDQAEMLANVAVSVNSNGVAADSGHDTLVVRLQKVNGHWLISDIPDHN